MKRDHTSSPIHSTGDARSEELFATVFRFCPDAIGVSDFVTRQFIEVNESYEHLLGYRRDELIGRTAAEMGLWAVLGERERMVERLARERSFHDEVRLRRRDGSVRICRVGLSVSRFQGRDVIVSVVRDRTELLERERILRESEEKFATVFRSSPDGIALSHYETGRLLDVNASYASMFGFAREEVLGRTTVELGIFENVAERSRLIEALRLHRSVRNWEVACRTRAGEPRCILYSGEVIDLGGAACMLSVLHDFTAAKQAAERERAAREEFTRGLIDAQEAERRRIAGELHDGLGQELLLVRNRAEFALAAAPPEPLRWHFEDVRRTADRAIADVRRISHDLRPYQLDHLGLTRAVEALIEATADSTGLGLDRKLDPIDDLFDPEASTNLYRVIQEALSNMVHHAQASRGRVTIERDIGMVEVAIEDNGRGMPAEPAPNGTAAGRGGLGLRGMAERVRILGGSLRIDSAAGRGVRIAFSVPVSREAPP